ncbi:malonyl-CoA synthase [Mesobacterium sp. TK19101]|uniref:Malonyl-CoA synthase n=1 Tax=Mesobacterium hydrothermale TaxID=3111907 RepID=A0ABU6HFX7_9RHOB|nr:malonyl-CoA synthase [Mesobacterium sp. TK19101]MEC3861364.1 malonyl-CoA synthase [Mesobacterium sp. TK19101]
MPQNHLIDALSQGLRETPEKHFVVNKGAQRSYAALFDGAARMAGRLVALGLAPGDRVAVQVEKSVEALQLYLATVMAGGVFLPLNTAYTADEVAYFLGDATPRILVCDPARKDALAPHAAGARVLTMDANGATDFDWAGQGPLTPVARGPQDLAAILYTSGTTGRSKGAMLSHANLLSNSETLRDYWRFTSDDVLIHALPIFHTHGLFVATNVALLAGAAIHFLPKFDADAIVHAMPGATALMGVPTFYTRLLADPRLTPEHAANMRLFISGSAPLLASTHREWEARTGHRILERYGMTETNMNTSNPYEGERRAGTVGFPLPAVELRVMANGAEVGPDEIGVIEVRGPNVFQGYWQMPEKTAEELRPDGWFITGDQGMVDADGYVTIVGRAKDMIITGGFNVYPKEVESLIDAQPGVKESAVIGVPHPDMGEGVVAVVVAEGELAVDALQAAIGEKLARFKQPRIWHLVDALPRNTMGKVQKKVLRYTYSDAFKAK